MKQSASTKEDKKDSSNSLRITGIVMSLIERILNINFEILGEENIPKDKAILFTSNHYTRFETMVMPYILNKIKGLKYCRSLAYKDLFVGKLGEYLESVKVLSTGDANKSEIITSDLINKKYNWIIYPEGEMVKDKKIFTTSPRFFKTRKGMRVSAKTGSAVLAMQAEMQNKVKGEIFICPVTISYRPIHAKPSKLYNVIKKLLRKPNLPKRIEEEIFYEASLLTHSKICIEFHKAICVRDYITQNSKFIKYLPITKNLENKIVLNNLRYSLTNEFMHRIYVKTPITFDHFFAYTVYMLTFRGTVSIPLSKLREVLFFQISNFLILNNTKWQERFRSSSSINFWHIPKLLTRCSDFALLKDTLSIFTEKKLGYVENDTLFLNKQALLENHDFHEIRTKNMFRVLFNEFHYFKRIRVNNVEAFDIKEDVVRGKNGVLLQSLMELDFLQDRKGLKNVKTEDVGRPFFFKGANNIGVLLSHGYRASPAEMKELGTFLNSKGYSVYGLRLKGHGTCVEDMKKRTAEDWLYSYKIGFQIITRASQKVCICGFSMGGLLTLILAEELKPSKIITISAALKIADFKFQLTGIAKTLSDFVGKFSKTTKDYLETTPEYPETNYKRHYLSSLYELKRLVEMTGKTLPKIKTDILIIQGAEDKLVSPSSGMEIYKNIGSINKQIYEPNFGKRHVIVRGEGSEKIFNKIEGFLKDAT